MSSFDRFQRMVNLLHQRGCCEGFNRLGLLLMRIRAELEIAE